MNIGVVIPAYNEGNHIYQVVKKAKELIDHIIVINDGSSDQTKEQAASAGAVVIDHHPNQGKGACIATGITYLIQNNFDLAIFMDADGQHSPEEISAFLERYNDTKANILIGNRLTDCKNMPFIRYATNRFTSFIVSLLCRQSVPDSQCGFRLFEVAALKTIPLDLKKFDAESQILIDLSKKGYKIDSVKITTIYGEEKSHVNPFIDTLRFFKLVIYNIFKS